MVGRWVGTYRSYELIDAGEPLFCLNAALHLPLVTLLVPDLESLVELAHEMSAYLVVNNAIETAPAVLRWIANVDARLACLWVMSHTCRRNLGRFELHGKQFFEAQILVVVVEDLQSLVL